jgi:hypothetical protein
VFREHFEDIAKVCSVDGVRVNSHKLETRVRITCINEENDSVDYVLVGTSADQLGGCGCWSGVNLIIRKI